MAEQNWFPIKAAEKGKGLLRLRQGSGSLDPVFVGWQGDDGRWFCGAAEVHPTHFCEIPLFGADEAAAGEPAA